MDTDTLDGFAPDGAAASSNSLWSNVEGVGHAVAGAWDVLNGSLNHVLSSGLRLIGGSEEANMSDRFMQQRWDSATEHFKQMHKDFDGTAGAATDSLDALAMGGQDDWATGGACEDGSADQSLGDCDPAYSDDYSQDSDDADVDEDASDDYSQDSDDGCTDRDASDDDGE